MLVRHLNVDSEIDRCSGLSHCLVKRLGLRDRARESIQNEAFPAVRLRDTVRYEIADKFVRHELSGIHIALSLFAQFRSVLDVRPEDVAG